MKDPPDPWHVFTAHRDHGTKKHGDFTDPDHTYLEMRLRANALRVALNSANEADRKALAGRRACQLIGLALKAIQHYDLPIEPFTETFIPPSARPDGAFTKLPIKELGPENN